MDAKVTWQQDLSFVGETDKGHQIHLDGGPGSGVMSPVEMVAVSLAGCSAMDVISILDKKQQKVSHFEINVNGTRSSEYPKVFTQAVMTYRVTGRHLEREAVLRAIELSLTKYCPVYAMLSKAFPIEIRYEILEGDGSRHSLVEAGEYRPDQAA